MKVLSAGAGGFIGGHLVKRLLDEKHNVRSADIKPFGKWFQTHRQARNHRVDLSLPSETMLACEGIDWVFNLAADMGGMGFLDAHRVDCLHNVDITSNMIRSAYQHNVLRYFQASSACIYPDYKQQVLDVSLKESDAWPADPEPAYGLEKLYGEELCKWYRQELGFETRVARFHNVFGPAGSYDGGREKAPAAICRKVILAKLSNDYTIQIWGDGEQTRSFMYIDDCIEGMMRLMKSDVHVPLNLGSNRLVSINELVSIVEEIAGVTLKRRYEPTAPQGVRGRNSDNTLIRKLLGWEPSIPLEVGLEKTYAWIYDQMALVNG